MPGKLNGHAYGIILTALIGMGATIRAALYCDCNIVLKAVIFIVGLNLTALAIFAYIHAFMDKES